MLVNVKATSYLEVAVKDADLRASPLPNGRSPRVEIRDPSGLSYYVADFNNLDPWLVYGVKKEIAILLDQENELPLSRIISLEIRQNPGRRVDATAVVEYAGFVGLRQTLTINVSLPDARFKGPWGSAPARSP